MKDTPRLIDEWQIVPKLWDAIRFEVDHRGEDGQFMLRGSAVPASTSEIFATTLHPSLFESKHLCSRELYE